MIYKSDELTVQLHGSILQPDEMCGMSEITHQKVLASSTMLIVKHSQRQKAAQYFQITSKGNNSDEELSKKSNASSIVSIRVIIRNIQYQMKGEVRNFSLAESTMRLRGYLWRYAQRRRTFTLERNPGFDRCTMSLNAQISGILAAT